MANLNHIAGAEPSTITFKVKTVTQTVNSSLMHMEVLAIGDPEATSSNAIAAVLNATPASTAWALAVRDVAQQSTIVAVSSLGGVVSVQQNSTVWAVQLTQYSTTVNVSSLAGKVLVDQNSTVWQVQARLFDSSAVAINASTAAPATGDNGLIVRQVGYSTIVAISSLGGAVITRSSAANMLVSVYQSSAAELNVTVAGYSTIAAISSVAGIVAVRPSDTSWASSAGFHFDGSGNLNVAGTFSASTIVAVSSVSGIVSVKPNDTSWHINAGLHFDGSGNLLVTGISQSTTANSTVNVSSIAGIVQVYDATYVQGSSYTWSTVAGGMAMARASSATPASAGGDDRAVTLWASMQGALNVIARDSTGGLVTSTTVTVSNYSTIAAVSSVAGKVTVDQISTVWAVQLTQYSTIVAVSSLAGIVSVKDVTYVHASSYTFSSIAGGVFLGRASSATPATVGGDDRMAAIWLSMQGAVNVIARDSTGGLVTSTTVTAAQAGTWNIGTVTTVSSLAGVVNVIQTTYQHDAALTFSTVAGGMNIARASSATPAGVSADNDAVALWASVQGALNVILRDSTGLNISASTTTASSAANGLVVRQALDAPLTNASSNFFTSSLVAINSTATGQKCCVYAYSITTTNQTPTKLAFYEGTNLKWPIVLAAISSAVSGANLAVSPPGCLFESAAGSSVTLRINSSGAGWKVGVSYFMRP